MLNTNMCQHFIFPACPDEDQVELGMENGIIADDYLEYSSDSVAGAGRLNKVPWRPGSSDNNAYMIINLDREQEVTEVWTQGGGALFRYITTIAVFCKQDGDWRMNGVSRVHFYIVFRRKHAYTVLFTVQ